MLRGGSVGQVSSTTRGLQKLKWDWYSRPDLEGRSVTDIVDLDQIASDLSHTPETLTDQLLRQDQMSQKRTATHREL
jgi:hypothetical protein